MTEWPFSTAELTAGLRRYLGQPGLRVAHLWEEPNTARPAIGAIRGLGVKAEWLGGARQISLLVKEPRGTTRAGLAGVGRREVGLYRSLASQLPVSTPAFIAGDPGGAWLILESLPPALPIEQWSADDYRRAVIELARLHDRFWGLAEDLANYPWLGRPFASDFEIHVMAAAQALEKIIFDDILQVITGWSERTSALARLIGETERVVEPLRAEPQTFLHGDYWPGNLAVLSGGRQVVYDWQLAGVGPGIVDLVVFIKKSLWWFESMPVEPETLTSLYRAEIAKRAAHAWTDEQWRRLWDHAVMWRFVQEWLDLLAALPPALIQARSNLLEEVWILPVVSAVERQLGTA